VSPGVSQVSLRYLLVSFSVIGASSLSPGDSFGKVTDVARYAPDLPQLHRILLIPNVHFFTFFPDVAITGLASCGARHKYFDLQYSPVVVSLSPNKVNISATIANSQPKTHQLWCQA